MSRKCYFPSTISQINFITNFVQARTQPIPGKNLLKNKKCEERKNDPAKISIIYFSKKCPLRSSTVTFRSKTYETAPNLKLNTKNYSQNLKLSKKTLKN